MKNELKQDFTRRLSNCNKSQLVVIIYDILMAYVDDAKDSLENGNRDGLKDSVARAQEFIDELSGSLDFSYEISATLYSLYTYCKKQLSVAIYEGKPDKLDEVAGIMGTLRDSFNEVAKTDESEPLMTNTEQVYAGMTYGKTQLNEDYSNNSQRGFFV